MNEHPCNSCGTVESLIVNEAGYCAECADKSRTPAEVLEEIARDLADGDLDDGDVLAENAASHAKRLLRIAQRLRAVCERDPEDEEGCLTHDSFFIVGGARCDAAAKKR